MQQGLVISFFCQNCFIPLSPFWLRVLTKLNQSLGLLLPRLLLVLAHSQSDFNLLTQHILHTLSTFLTLTTTDCR
jgi:choline-glycine betaine transporter